MIIECPSCKTKFAIDASLLLDIEVPRFHCSRCDYFFESDQKTLLGEDKEPPIAEHDENHDNPTQLNLLAPTADLGAVPAAAEPEDAHVSAGEIRTGTSELVREEDARHHFLSPSSDDLPFGFDEEESLADTRSFGLGALEQSLAPRVPPTVRSDAPSSRHASSRHTIATDGDEVDEPGNGVCAEWPKTHGEEPYHADLTAFSTAPLAEWAKRGASLDEPARGTGPVTGSTVREADDPEPYRMRDDRAPDVAASGRWVLGSFDDPAPERNGSCSNGHPDAAVPASEPGSAGGAGALSDSLAPVTTRMELLGDDSRSRKGHSFGSLLAQLSASSAASAASPSAYPSALASDTAAPGSSAADAGAITGSRATESIPAFEREALSARPHVAAMPHDRGFSAGKILARSAVGFICSVPLIFTGAIWVGSRNLESAPPPVKKLLQIESTRLPRLAPSGLEVVDLTATTVGLDNGQKVLELRGALLNTTANSYGSVKLDARLFDSDNNQIARLIVPAASGITTATLSSLTPEALDSLQQRPALDKDAVKPNEKRPLRVVFTSPQLSDDDDPRSRVGSSNAGSGPAWYSLRVYSVTLEGGES